LINVKVNTNDNLNTLQIVNADNSKAINTNTVSLDQTGLIRIPELKTIKNSELEPSYIAKKINKYLGGVLKDKGIVFAMLGGQYDVNPYMVAAIAIQETGNGTSDAAVNLNNVGGMMGKNDKLIKYKSVEDCLEGVFKNLKENYIDIGLTDIATIGKKYCPVGAKNDPTNLNKHWTPNVTEYYLQMRNSKVD
jgi:hypothetical protein